MQQNKKYPLEKALKQAFEDQELEVPAELWNTIEQNTISKKASRRKFWFLAISFLLITMAVFSTWKLQKSPNNKKYLQEKVQRISNDKTFVEKSSSQNSKVLPISSLSSKRNEFDDIKTVISKSLVKNVSNRFFKKEKSLSQILSENRTHKSTMITQLESEPIVSKHEAMPSAVTTSVIFKIETPKAMRIPNGLLKRLQVNPPNAFAKKSRKNPIAFSMAAGPAFFDLESYQPFLRAGAISNVQSKTNGYGLGLLVQKTIAEKQRLGLGLQYSRKNVDVFSDVYVSASTFNNYYREKQPIPLGELTEVDCNDFFTIQNALLSYKSEALKLQLQYGYRCYNKGKLSIFSNLAVEPNIILKNKINTRSSLVTNLKETSILDIVNASIAFPITYQINKHVQVGIEPSIHKQIFGTAFNHYQLNKEVFIPLTFTYR